MTTKPGFCFHCHQNVYIAGHRAGEIEYTALIVRQPKDAYLKVWRRDGDAVEVLNESAAFGVVTLKRRASRVLQASL